MKKLIIITLVTLGSATGILSSQTTIRQSVKPEVMAVAPSASSAFRKDLGQAD